MERRHNDLDWLARQNERLAEQKFNEEVVQEQPLAGSEAFGRLFASNDLLKQELEYVSDGVDDQGNEYQLFLGRISRAPIVRNPETNSHFILPWSDVIRLAKKAGLDRRSPPSQ